MTRGFGDITLTFYETKLCDSDMNPIYAGLERSCPRESKIVSYVDVGPV